MVEKVYNYVFVTTNIINGIRYVGDHSTNNLSDNYLGSGIYLKRAIRKYGRRNFKREIIESFKTKDDAFNSQEKYIKLYNTLTPNGYNVSPKGGVGINECHSEETKENIRKALKDKPKSEEHIKNISHSKRGKNNPMYGKRMSQKTKEQIIKSNINRSGEKNSMYGKHHNKETKQLISELHKGKPKTNVHKQHISESHYGKRYITNGLITKQIKKDEPIPKDWKLGRRKK